MRLSMVLNLQPMQLIYNLKLKASKEGLIFECINSVEEDEVLHSGIGHKNLRRRLELLFPNRHQLQLQMKDNQYHAILSLKL